MTATDTSELDPRGAANETPSPASGSPFPTPPLSATPPGAPRPMRWTDTSELGPRGAANETPSPASGSPFPTFPTPPFIATPPGAPRPMRRTSRMEDLLDQGVLLLRALAGLFSLVALIVLASNKHGDWEDFSRYQEYRYLLAVSVLAVAYSLAQIIRQRSRTRDGLDLVPIRYSWIVDFSGDQIRTSSPVPENGFIKII